MLKGYFPLFFLPLIVLFSLSVKAQSPTPEQIKMFQSLPEEQQQALASKYGLSFPNANGNSVKYIEAQSTVKPRPQQNETIKQKNGASKGSDLRRFGVDLFSGSPSTFAPTSEAPIPANYVVGPGDEIVVQLYGKENRTLRLQVTREGVINFPSLGPIELSGLSFSDVRQSLTQRIKEQKIGVSSDITLGKMRTMQIFVMGDAYKPGAYTVSALTTISQAIYYSGGFGDKGALRNIQVKRNGNVIRRLDMYELLLSGDTRNDIRLMPGDVVLIGSLGDTIRVEGEVNRPAIYEIKSGQSYQSAIQMAGGFTANALKSQVNVIRYTSDDRRDALNIDFYSQNERLKRVAGSDHIKVMRKSEALDRYIELVGDVKHPGFKEFKSGMKVADLFPSLDRSFNPTADVNYSLIVREVNIQRDIKIHQVNLANAILSPDSSDNILLHPKDRLLVFNRFSQEMLDTAKSKDIETQTKSFEQAKKSALEDELNEESKLDNIGKLTANSRSKLLAPVLLQLQYQSRLGSAPKIAEVAGEVKHPGRYPLNTTTTVSELLEAAGGLTYKAYTNSAELTHKVVQTDEVAKVNVKRVDLNKIISGDVSSNIFIQGLDRLNIFEKPNVKKRNTVTLKGEVRFPGSYTVYQGETLADVLERAGGLTDLANPQGAIFTRESLRLQEQKLLNQYAADVRRETAKKAFHADGNFSSVIANPDKTLSFVEEASKSKALGRMVVELDRITNGEQSANFLLEDGDFLFVPIFRNTISIMGETQVAITYLLDNKLDVDDYINKAGGMKKQADEERIFVVRADGSVYKPTSGYWFGNSSEELKPGDTIVVPVDTHYRDALSTWTAATQILYQTGVAINALK